jgi:valyl-tRNA synthetase
MELLIEVISAIRNVRGEMGLPPGMALEAVVCAADEDTRVTVEGHRELVTTLARLKSLEVTDQPQRPRGAATAVARGATIFVRLEGIIDFTKETERLQKELGKLSKELTAVCRKLDNQDFLAKAPADIVAKVNAQHREITEKQQKIQANLDRIQAYDSAP